MATGSLAVESGVNKAVGMRNEQLDSRLGVIDSPSP
jgi:hypothetical protein